MREISFGLARMIGGASKSFSGCFAESIQGRQITFDLRLKLIVSETMEILLLRFLGVAIMAVSLFLIPLGLPGTWVMVAVVAVAAMLGQVSVWVFLAALTISAAAELAEFIVVKKLTGKFGGTNRAFWAAVIGGFIGIIIGLPVPVIGSILAGFLGSFVGAALVTLAETRKISSSSRVGAGVLIGRALAITFKTGAGIAVLALGATAILF